MDTSTPSTRQLVALVLLVAVVLTAGCVLYALTPEAGRVGLWDKLTTAGPGAGALVAALLAWLGVRRVNTQQAAQHVENTTALAQITHQTNGVLEQRMSDAVAQQLDARGLDSVSDWWQRNQDQIESLRRSVEQLPQQLASPSQEGTS